MDKDFKNNVAATFAANPKEDKFFADAAGHCFNENNAAETLTPVSRKDFEAEIATVIKSQETPAATDGGESVPSEGKTSKKK